MKIRFTKNQKIIAFFTILTRLLFPFLILKEPIIGILICIALDTLDFGIYLATGVRVDHEELSLYQRIDKSLDQYYYTFILFYFISNFFNHLLNIVLILYFLSTVH